MYKLRSRFIVLLMVLLLGGCDAKHVVRMVVAPKGMVTISAPALIEQVTKKAGLSAPFPGSPNSFYYQRAWNSVADGHPRSIELSALRGVPNDTWRIDIFEWRVWRQTPFGADLQAALTKAFTTHGYTVTLGE